MQWEIDDYRVVRQLYPMIADVKPIQKEFADVVRM